MNSRTYFDEVAPEWDKMRTAFFSEAVRDRALEVGGAEKGMLAADIGAGTGFITEGLVRRGLRVIAVDSSESMLQIMKRKFAGVEEIDYRVGDACKLPISSRTVDRVFANMYLHHVNAPHKAIREMARILKSGGMLVLTDMDEHHFGFLRVEHHDRWLGFRREDIYHWFTAAGLKNVTVDCAGENCCADSGSGSEHASVSIFVASGRK